MKKILIVLFVLLLALTSCQAATQNLNEEENTEKELVSLENSEPIMPIERPEKDYIRFNGELVDLADVTVDKNMSYERFVLETFEMLEEFYMDRQSDAFLLKITVIDYPEPTRILYDTGTSRPYTSIPCRIDSIIYKGEEVDLCEGQNISLLGQYFFTEKNDEVHLVMEPGEQVLRKGYSYIVYGLYTQLTPEDGYYDIDTWDGCFEISSDAEKNAFAQSLGLNYSPINPVQDDVFEKYADALTPSELAIVKKEGNTTE